MRPPSRHLLGATVAGAGLAGAAVGSAIVRGRRAARRMIAAELRPRTECDVRHARKVERIAAQLRAHDAAIPVSLRKQARAHQVPDARELWRRDPKIDISSLTEIIDLDPVSRVCVAEAGVMFVDLVHATLRHGLVPAVVPELGTVTIAGAVSGCSIESSSFRHGGFHDSCLEYEVITAEGDVLTCRPDNEHDLVFQMMHGSFGTLGILSRLTFRLVPARRYVRVDYETYPDLEDLRHAIQRHVEDDDVDFLDAILHAPDHLVLCCGRFVDTAPYTSRYDWTKVYYRSTATRLTDYLTTPAYLFRYQVLRLADRLPRPFRSARPATVLDVFLPFSKLPEFLAWYERELGHFPLWCVPYRRVRDYEWLDERFYAGTHDSLFVDLAIYGMKQPRGVNVHRVIEQKLLELGGIKTLIAHNYFTPDEFWSIWNRRNYERVKQLTDPRNRFRDLYSKTCRAAMGLPG